MKDLYPRNAVLRATAVVPFFAVASWVAVTRTRDNWHNYDDVVTGALLGVACAKLVLSMHCMREAGEGGRGERRYSGRISFDADGYTSVMSPHRKQPQYSGL